MTIIVGDFNIHFSVINRTRQKHQQVHGRLEQYYQWPWPINTYKELHEKQNVTF